MLLMMALLFRCLGRRRAARFLPEVLHGRRQLLHAQRNAVTFHISVSDSDLSQAGIPV